MRAIWKIAFFQNAIFLNFFFEKIASEHARSLTGGRTSAVKGRRAARAPTGAKRPCQPGGRGAPARLTGPHGRRSALTARGRPTWGRGGAPRSASDRSEATPVFLTESLYTHQSDNYVTAGSRHLYIYKTFWKSSIFKKFCITNEPDFEKKSAIFY